jgi:tripartite-type tricarboxylate transporter receptor subunit TctC
MSLTIPNVLEKTYAPTAGLNRSRWSCAGAGIVGSPARDRGRATEPFALRSRGATRFCRVPITNHEKAGVVMNTHQGVVRRALFGALMMFAGVSPGDVFSQAPFYQGKTITIIAGTAPGGIGDNRVKSMVPFLRKYIPGSPAIVVQYMDGGGGRQVGNHMFRNARPDGLTIGAFSSSVIGLNILRESGVMYDVDKFIYLGSPESSSHLVFYTRRDAGFSNLEKLRAASGIRVGARPVGHSAYIAARLFAYFLDLKEPRFIPGYGAPELDLALTNGEVDARANTATSVWQRNPDWVEKGLMHFHAIYAIPKDLKHDRFGHLPEIESFAKSETERRLLALSRIFRLTGSPYVLPPGTSKERIDTINAAIRKTFNDPDFHREYRKIVGEDASPMSPEELTKAIQETPRDPELIELFKTFSGAAPLPPRS